MEKNKEIPTHDPYTGELNPYYKELTGKNNPLESIINHELYAKIKQRELKYDTNSYSQIKPINYDRLPFNVQHIFNQKWYKIMSFIKSGLRIIGYGFIPFNLTIACLILIFSEVIGIFEDANL